MTIREFLTKHGFQPYASHVNSWDSFREDGTVLMQLWERDSKRVSSSEEAYLRIRCKNSEHFATAADSHRVGYAGREKAIEQLRMGKRGYVVLSAPPAGTDPGPGIWAKYVNFERAYPVLDVEEEATGDVFVLVRKPVPVDEL